ncbi:MAG: alpha-ketoacid dehydrogenase subunit beta [Candidatus Caldatribacteriota bacterium]|nr:alpha-ketoacid dehydrogenase subunit beta [Candidatus Caldatribacteriota bacterium]
MSNITYIEALKAALREEMRRDKNVFIIGEDVTRYGFGVNRGLVDEFGSERVRNAPISEAAIIGSAVGAALRGMRPVAEIMFVDFIMIGMDQIVNQAAKMSYLSNGELSVPMVIRTPEGTEWFGGGAQHSQTLHSMFANIPGLKLVIPSDPYDAKGLLKSAIRDDNPVIFFEHKQLYTQKGKVPEEEYAIPLGKAAIKKEGKDLTLVATSWMVKHSLEVAEDLKGEISVEVIDPRTLVPLDKETIINSVKKTGRLLVVDESPVSGGMQGEIISMVMQEAFWNMEFPPRRIGSLNTPIPFSESLEKEVIPTKGKIKKEILTMFSD